MEKIKIEEIHTGYIAVKNQGGYSCEAARTDATQKSLNILTEKLNEIIEWINEHDF